jgi:cobalamin 5'-phosphate synthase/cobalamin synthase
MSLLAAIAFLTRIPIRRAFSTEETARASAWFPLIGGLLGALYAAIWFGATRLVPAYVAAVLVLIAEALLTGALHFDGLADTADGFGGGRTRDDVLRIMRDHAIGTYGAIALALMLLLTAACLVALKTPLLVAYWLIAGGALGRWAIVLMSRALPYARLSNAVSAHIGTRELILATVPVCALGFLLRWQALLAAALTLLVAIALGWYFRRRIGGVTGDTLGATAQICETIVLLTGVVLTR